MLRKALSVLFVALAVSACDSSDTTGLDGAVLDDAAIADAGPTDAAPITCANDDACPLDQHCKDGVCVPGDGNACTETRPCPEGQRCELVDDCGAMRCSGNTCVPTSTGTCSRNEDCASNEVCEGGRCAANTCMTSADCPADQRCQRGTCGPPCTGNDDCGSARFACDTASGECVARCFGDNTCPAGLICEQNLCRPAECTTDAECAARGPNQRCTGEDRGRGRCESFTPCDPSVPNTCPENFTCASNGECEQLPRCVGDRSCAADAYCAGGFCQPATRCTASPCPSGFDCVADRCVPGACRGPSDCTTAGQTCIAGVCRTPPAPTTVVEVRILTPAGFVRPGTTYRFVAIALAASGEVVPGVRFEWTSTATTVANIDASGLATGGARAGTTQITAAVDTGTDLVTSTPVRLVNLGALQPGELRVVAQNQASGAAIANARVELRTSAGLSRATTDATGVARFADVPAGVAVDLTVADPAYDFVSVLGVAGRDLVVPLPPLTRPTIGAGVTGPIDLSQVSSSGALSFSLSGASFASPLLGTDGTALFGGRTFSVRVQNPFGGGGFDVPVPAAATVSFSLMGFPIDLKTTYAVEARAGLRAVWSFGGKLDVGGGGAGGGLGQLGNVLGAVLPFFQTLDHAVRPAVQLVQVPFAIDARDVDGDGDSGELLPDYASFPTVPLRPRVAQSLRYQLVVENARLPLLTDGNANALVVLSGTLVPGVGFVPLGLDGLQDDGGSGLVPSFTTRIAPAHSGLEVGEYAVLAIALRIANGLPGPGSARLFVSPSLPTAVDFTSGWLDAVRGAEHQVAARRVTWPTTAAGAVRVSFASNDGGWVVYAPAAARDLALMPTPMGLVDRTATATATLDAVSLRGGASWEALLDPQTGGALGLDRVTDGFARSPVRRR